MRSAGTQHPGLGDEYKDEQAQRLPMPSPHAPLLSSVVCTVHIPGFTPDSFGTDEQAVFARVTHAALVRRLGPDVLGEDAVQVLGVREGLRVTLSVRVPPAHTVSVATHLAVVLEFGEGDEDLASVLRDNGLQGVTQVRVVNRPVPQLSHEPPRHGHKHGAGDDNEELDVLYREALEKQVEIDALATQLEGLRVVAEKKSQLAEARQVQVDGLRRELERARSARPLGGAGLGGTSPAVVEAAAGKREGRKARAEELKALMNKGKGEGEGEGEGEEGGKEGQGKLQADFEGEGQVKTSKPDQGDSERDRAQSPQPPQPPQQQEQPESQAGQQEERVQQGKAGGGGVKGEGQEEGVAALRERATQRKAQLDGFKAREQANAGGQGKEGDKGEGQVQVDSEELEDIYDYTAELEIQVDEQQTLLMRQERSLEFLENQREELEVDNKTLRGEAATLRGSLVLLQRELTELREKELLRLSAEKKTHIKVPVKKKKDSGVFGFLTDIFGGGGEDEGEGEGEGDDKGILEGFESTLVGALGFFGVDGKDEGKEKENDKDKHKDKDRGKRRTTKHDEGKEDERAKSHSDPPQPVKLALNDERLRAQSEADADQLGSSSSRKVSFGATTSARSDHSSARPSYRTPSGRGGLESIREDSESSDEEERYSNSHRPSTNRSGDSGSSQSTPSGKISAADANKFKTSVANLAVTNRSDNFVDIVSGILNSASNRSPSRSPGRSPGRSPARSPAAAAPDHPSESSESDGEEGEEEGPHDGLLGTGGDFLRSFSRGFGLLVGGDSRPAPEDRPKPGRGVVPAPADSEHDAMGPPHRGRSAGSNSSGKFYQPPPVIVEANGKRYSVESPRRASSGSVGDSPRASPRLVFGN